MRQIGILFLLVAGLHAGDPGCVPLPAGMTGWLGFDEPMFRQRGPHAPTVIPGLVGSALRFNGKDQYFELPAGTKGWDPGDGDFTVELWVRTTNATRTVNIVDKRSHDPYGYLIFLWRGHPGFQVPIPDVHTNALAREDPIADGRWHHVAGIVRRSPMGPFHIYVDGRLSPSTARNVTLRNIDVAAPLWLGRHHANAIIDRDNIYFEGDIDELTFYRRALTPAEILSIYRAGAKGKCRPKTR